MRKQLFLQMAFLLFTFCIVKAQVPTNGLVEYFSFDNTFTGFNGGSITATANFVNDRFSSPSRANNFATGQGTATTTVTGMPLGNSTRTIAFWFSSNSSTDHQLFNYGTGGGGVLSIAYSASQQRIFISNFQTDFSVASPYSTNWKHFAITYNGSQATVYLDGVLITTNNISFNTTNTNPRIGVQPSGTQGANFKMDDLFIYNRALSAQEVTEIYNQATCFGPINTTSFANLNKCISSSTILSVSGNNITWHDAPTGGNLLGSGNLYTTPVINSTTSYYAQVAGCNIRTEIQVNIITSVPAAPANTTDPSLLIACEGGTTILQASGVGEIRWYDALTGGNLIAIGNSFTTAPLPAPPGTLTYFAEDVNGCGGSPRTAITVTADNSAVPTIINTSTFAGTNLCFNGASGLITVSSPTAQYYWFNNPGFPPVDSFNTQNSIVLSSSGGSYIVQARAVSGVCVSDPIDITVYISASPIAIPNASTNNFACPGSSVVLTASGGTNPATYYWYDAPTGGNLLGIGSSFTTPNLTSPTSFYVQTGQGSCASGRREAVVNISPVPTATISNVNDTIRSSNTLFNGYVLRRDGVVVASSTTTGNIAYPIDACGDYQASFTNTFNNCPNRTVSYTRFYDGANFACMATLTFNNFPLPITWNVNFFPSYPTPVTVSNTNQVNIILRQNATACTSLPNVAYVSVQDANGCLYQFIFTPSNPGGNINVSSTTDTVTTCAITSNTLTVNSLGQGAPINTTAANQLSICTGESTTLTATGIGTLYWFDVPSGGTALANGNSFNTGVLTANKTFYVQSGDGVCASTRIAIEVTVNNLPNAAISPATVTICEGESATLTASGGTYEWSNSGGSNATATFSPTTNTTYTVTVTANGCSATASRIVTVNPLPTASISPATPSICLGESQVLVASGSGATFEWSNGLGVGTTKTVSPITNTTYTVTVTTVENCSATASVTVTVNNVVAAINGPTTICSGLDATLIASGGSSYVWSNNATTASITVTPTTATNYSVTVTGAGNCSATASQTVDVQNAPTATINGITTICNGESTTLTANGGNTYEWSNGETTTSITVSPTTNTDYSVTVSIGVNCTASETTTVTVNQPSATTLNETICFGETYELNGTVYDATNIYTQVLINDAGCDSTVTLNLTVRNENVTNLSVIICNTQAYEFDGQQLDQDGNYSAVFTDANGCDSTVNLALTIVSEFTETVNVSICEGESYLFDGQQLTIADTYTATFTSAGGCDSIVTLNLTVNALPQPTAVANNADLSTQQFTTYQWQLNGNDIQGADQQNYTATQNGDYSVKVTDANGCENISDAVNVTIVSVANYDLGFKVYPNPTSGIVNIETAINNAEINIITLEGKVLFSQKTTNNKTAIDLTSLAHGMYIIEMKAENAINRVRVVKE